MSDDHIAIKLDGVIYVKLDDVRPMRDRIEQLEAENAELQSKVGTIRLAAKYAAKIRDDRIAKLEAALREIAPH